MEQPKCVPIHTSHADEAMHGKLVLDTNITNTKVCENICMNVCNSFKDY